MTESNPCITKDKGQACVPYFIHVGVIEHVSRANRRMLIALLCVCVTFIITIIIFVQGYTTREQNWLDTMAHMQTGQITEAADEGVQQQPSP